MRGDDDQETALVRRMLEQARNYLQSFVGDIPSAYLPETYIEGRKGGWKLLTRDENPKLKIAAPSECSFNPRMG